jgi:hypothetical protein
MLPSVMKNKEMVENYLEFKATSLSSPKEFFHISSHEFESLPVLDKENSGLTQDPVFIPVHGI